MRLLYVALIVISLGDLACRMRISTNPEPLSSNEIVHAEALLPLRSESNTHVDEFSSSLSLIESTNTPASPLALATVTNTPQTVLAIATSVPISTPTAVSTPSTMIPAQSPPEHIFVPAIGLDAAVTTTGWTIIEQDGKQTSTWSVPVNDAGWHENSALPGQGSNVVLSGHHNIEGEVFRYLVDLKLGDEITLQADSQDYYYVVTSRFILPEVGISEEQRQQNAQWIMPTKDERLTLVTCWPYNSNSHRLIIIAKPPTS